MRQLKWLPLWQDEAMCITCDIWEANYAPGPNEAAVEEIPMVCPMLV